MFWVCLLSAQGMLYVLGDTFCAASLCKPREAVPEHHSRSLPLPPEALGLLGWVGSPGLGSAWGLSGFGFSTFCFMKCLGCFTAHVPIPHVLSWHQWHAPTSSESSRFSAPCKISTWWHSTPPQVTALLASASAMICCQGTNCCLCLPCGKAAGTRNEVFPPFQFNSLLVLLR